LLLTRQDCRLAPRAITFVGNTIMSNSADIVIIERETLQRLARYTRSIDGRDWEGLNEVFAEDCVKVRVGADGVTDSQPLLRGGQAIIEDLERNLGRLGPTQHLLGNHEVERLGGEVESRTYVRAFHRGAGDKRSLWLDIMGEYRIGWRQTPQGWRAARWSLRIIDSVGDPAAVAPAE
jgi:hypothetical protein